MGQHCYPAFPPQSTDEELSNIMTSIQDWSITYGLAVRPAPSFISQSQDPNTSLAVTAPVTLFPSPFPRNCFTTALAIQKAYNELYVRIASDEKWLQPVVEDLVDIDDFMAQLWSIHLKVKEEGYSQDLSLGLFRSDYLVHATTEASEGGIQTSLRQVEFNTIASSFGGLSTRVSSMHAYLSKAGIYSANGFGFITTQNLANSSSATALASGLAESHRAYGNGSTAHPKCVLFLVQTPERNVFDQRIIEYNLVEKHDIRTYRLPFSDVLSHTRLEADRSLIYTPPQSKSEQFEVTTLYFRAGYSPSDYQGPESWEARLHLERSRAIKCPSILTHLSGAKKVQQVLATPDSPHLSRFLRDPKIAKSVQETFAPIYPLDGTPAGLEARKLALDPETARRYVLKPQREGGGNNIYRSKIPDFLKSLPESQWPAYILMEMIDPPPLRNAILRNGQVQQGGVIGELGVYGTVLWRNKVEGGVHIGVQEIISNNEAGHLLRTKGDTSEEGGVAAGFGAVDSVLLVDT